MPAQASLEHVNITVIDNAETARWMEDVFGWKIRWQGPAMSGIGHTIHIGTDSQYVALYSPNNPAAALPDRIREGGRLYHVAVVVDDLIETEAKVINAGFEPENHGDYEPGRRFYFYDNNGIEFEVVNYTR